MLETVMRYLNNYFIVKDGVHEGRFVVEDGRIDLPFLANGQYFAIRGSVFNDGVFQYPVTDADTLYDEEFVGEVWALAVPRQLLETVKEINEWIAQYGKNPGAYQSESFGGYSYSRASGGAGGGVATWQSTFIPQLKKWRKLP